MAYGDPEKLLEQTLGKIKLKEERIINYDNNPLCPSNLKLSDSKFKIKYKRRFYYWVKNLIIDVGCQHEIRPAKSTHKQIKKWYYTKTGRDLYRDFRTCMYDGITYLEYKPKEEIDYEGYVYVIGNVEMGFVKIGHSADPVRRLSEIQTGCPYKVKILRVYDGDYKLENQLQKKYSEYRMHGEWFKLEGELKESLGL